MRNFIVMADIGVKNRRFADIQRMSTTFGSQGNLAGDAHLPPFGIGGTSTTDSHYRWSIPLLRSALKTQEDRAKRIIRLAADLDPDPERWIYIPDFNARARE